MLRRRATKDTLVCFPRSGCPTKKEVSRAQSPPSLPSRSLINICHGHCSPLGRSPGAPSVPLQPRPLSGVASAVPRRLERGRLLLPDSAQPGAGDPGNPGADAAAVAYAPLSGLRLRISRALPSLSTLCGAGRPQRFIRRGSLL